jgi:hypothetical protein
MKQRIYIDTSTKQTKEFDCVRMMRDIRDKIDIETAGMTYTELRTYLDKQLENDAFWQQITRQQKASKYAS